MPGGSSHFGFVETIPDLVVEVRGKNALMAELARKARVYLAAGVRTVWIVDEASRAITIEEPDAAPIVVGGDEPIPCTLRLNPIRDPAHLPCVAEAIQNRFDQTGLGKEQCRCCRSCAVI